MKPNIPSEPANMCAARSASHRSSAPSWSSASAASALSISLIRPCTCPCWRAHTARRASTFHTPASSAHAGCLLCKEVVLGGLIAGEAEIEIVTGSCLLDTGIDAHRSAENKEKPRPWRGEIRIARVSRAAVNEATWPLCVSPITLLQASTVLCARPTRSAGPTVSFAANVRWHGTPINHRVGSAAPIKATMVTCCSEGGTWRWRYAAAVP
jgi:hypothetical protein